MCAHSASTHSSTLLHGQSFPIIADYLLIHSMINQRCRKVKVQHGINVGKVVFNVDGRMRARLTGRTGGCGRRPSVGPGRLTRTAHQPAACCPLSQPGRRAGTAGDGGTYRPHRRRHWAWARPPLHRPARYLITGRRAAAAAPRLRPAASTSRHTDSPGDRDARPLSDCSLREPTVTGLCCVSDVLQL